ncbi:MAG: hypothetical protein GXP53_06395 [Deltaproteobacteria bacterium]|nr:hypothetical protein [Deltaproteobacteria bacterium]
MIKKLSYRVSLLIRSLFKSRSQAVEDDALSAFEAYSIQLEKHLNNVSASLCNFRARESVIRSDLKAAEIKIKKVDEKINSRDNQESLQQDQLIELKSQYHREADDLEQRLSQTVEDKKPIQQSYDELRKAIRNLLDQGEALKGRYYAADAKQTLYGDLSGTSSHNGLSKIDNLLNRVKKIEAQADALLDLAPTAVKIDAL